jgi:hypothetical protein
MELHSRTCTACSIGCGAAWSGILAVAAAEAGEDTRRALELVLPGWAGGWLSAAIARGPCIRRPGGGSRPARRLEAGGLQGGLTCLPASADRPRRCRHATLVSTMPPRAARTRSGLPGQAVAVARGAGESPLQPQARRSRGSPVSRSGLSRWPGRVRWLRPADDRLCATPGWRTPGGIAGRRVPARSGGRR